MRLSSDKRNFMPDLQVGTTTQVNGIIDTVTNNELINWKRNELIVLRDQEEE